jgi:hypothetical protein
VGSLDPTTLSTDLSTLLANLGTTLSSDLGTQLGPELGTQLPWLLSSIRSLKINYSRVKQIHKLFARSINLPVACASIETRLVDAESVLMLR